MKVPKAHQADETLARIMLAANRTQPGKKAQAAPPVELVEMPDDDAELAMPAEPSEGSGEPPVGDVPPITESGLDLGAVLGGADSFDAMLGSLGGK